MQDTQDHCIPLESMVIDNVYSQYSQLSKQHGDHILKLKPFFFSARLVIRIMTPPIDSTHSVDIKSQHKIEMPCFCGKKKSAQDKSVENFFPPLR